MPRRFHNVAKQAGYTAAEFGEGIETNYFLTPANREEWTQGHKTFFGRTFTEETRTLKDESRRRREAMRRKRTSDEKLTDGW